MTRSILGTILIGAIGVVCVAGADPTISMDKAPQTPRHDAADLETPVLSSDGTIACGTKSIRQALSRSPYDALILYVDDDVRCTGGESVDCGTGGINPIFFLDQKETVEDGSTVYRADVRANTSSDKKLGAYRLSLRLLENGLAKVESRCVLDDPALLKSRYFIFRIPQYMNVRGQYLKDGKAVAFDSKTLITFMGDDYLIGITF